MSTPDKPFRIPRVNPTEADSRIQQALSELSIRGVKPDYCPRCEHLEWNVDLVEIPARSALLFAVFPALAPQVDESFKEGFISVLTVVCRNCGYTIFHNLEILGVKLR